MSKDETNLEKQIKSKGLTAPRLKPSDIDKSILAEQYHVFESTTTTVCALTLRNGYVVIGHSGVVSPDNFDEEIGRKVARENARQKIWELEGYLLREKLSREGN